LEGGEIGGVMERDPEEKERERNLRRNGQESQNLEGQRHRDLRDPDRFLLPKKLIKRQQINEPATPVVTAAVVVILLVLGIIYVLVKGRSKIQSKTN
jgi:hypothetical protein